MLHKRSLRGRGGLRKTAELNPVEGAFNLVDAMLVFSCGLMVAIILNWGVQLKTVRVDPTSRQEFTERYEKLQDNSISIKTGDSYQEMGAVYQDKKTGKLYLIAPDKKDNKTGR